MSTGCRGPNINRITAQKTVRDCKTPSRFTISADCSIISEEIRVYQHLILLDTSMVIWHQNVSLNLHHVWL